MSQLVPIFTLFILLAAGMAAGKWIIKKNTRFFSYGLSTALFSLLFFMGFRLGRNQDIADKLPEIGELSFLFALITVLGTALVLGLYSLIHGFFPFYNEVTAQQDSHSPEQTAERWWSHFRDPAILLGFVVLGFTAGMFLPWFVGSDGSIISGLLLNLLLFIIGVQMIHDGTPLRRVFTDPAILIIPVAVVIGSLLGGSVLALWKHLPMGRALAVSAGFGWYSLSGVLISDMGDPMMGSIGFLANILRESLSLVIIPLISTTRFSHIGVGAAGATSMDVTLPLITRSCGSRAVPYALFSGSLLSLLVPILVPLLYHAGT